MTPANPLSATTSETRNLKLDMVPMKAESLPFTIRVVSNAGDLEKAVRIRHAAYMRHVPAFAQALKMPERSDSEQGVVVLLAESKFDGSPIGTMRIQTNEFNPLTLEQSVTLPRVGGAPATCRGDPSRCNARARWPHGDNRTVQGILSLLPKTASRLDGHHCAVASGSSLRPPDV
jgi:hypothetical protein